MATFRKDFMIHKGVNDPSGQGEIAGDRFGMVSIKPTQ